MKKLKKLLAGFMTLAMLVTMLPATVMADDSTTATVEVTTQEELQDAINDTANVGKIIRIKEGTYEVPSMKAGINLEGEGEVLLEGTLSGTLEDITLKNLHIRGGNAQRWAYAKGDLLFENVTFEATSVYALHFDGIAEGTNLTYKDCTIIGWAAMGGSPASCVFEGCTIKDNGTYGVIRTYFDATIKDCTFDVDNANTEDVYEDGIHAVDATVTVENCTNANGEMKDILNVSEGGKVKLDGKQVLPVVVAEVDGVPYASLQEALNAAGAAGAGDSTVEILVDEIDLTGVEWKPVKVDGYHGADVVTIEGNGCVITGLNAPLFEGGFAGGSGIVINDLTIADSDIVSTNGQGSGAFIECVDSMAEITLENCHLLDSTVTGSRTGGLIGWTSGYNNENDGPVKTYVTVTDCSVIGCTITGSSVGAINGHAGANPWTYTTIEDCMIKNNTLISTDDGSWRVGVVVGTANVGQVVINKITESGNTLEQTGKTAPEGQSNLFGRYVPSKVEADDSKLVIDGVEYKADGTPYVYEAEIVDGKKFETLAAALEAAEDGDEVKVLKEGTYELSTSGKDITITGAVDGVVFDNIGAKNMGGANITFNNVTFDYYPNVNYTGLQHSGNLVYNNCTINGQVFLYGASETFNECTFNQNSTDAYNVWTYGAKEVKFAECTFNSAGKAVLVYKEGEDASNPYSATFEECAFKASAAAGKAAIEIGSNLWSFNVTIKGCTFDETFDTASSSGNNHWNAKTYVEGTEGHSKTVDGTKTTITTGKDGSGNLYTVVVNETTTPAEDPTPDEPTPSRPSSSNKSSKKYSVEVEDTEDGTVKVSSTRAKKGATVTITVTPDKGYELDELVVLDKDGEEIEVKDKGNGKFTFVMPRGGVEIEASFEEADDEPVVDEPVVDEPAAEEEVLVLTINQVIYQLNGEYLVNDVAPIIKGDRTMLPIRLIAEFLGADVTWNEAEQSVTIVKDDTTIVIYIGQAFALVNGNPVQLDAPAFIANDRTYLPLRFVAENLGAEVVWDGANNTVTIYK